MSVEMFAKWGKFLKNCSCWKKRKREKENRRKIGKFFYFLVHKVSIVFLEGFHDWKENSTSKVKTNLPTNLPLQMCLPSSCGEGKRLYICSSVTSDLFLKYQIFFVEQKTVHWRSTWINSAKLYISSCVFITSCDEWCSCFEKYWMIIEWMY